MFPKAGVVEDLLRGWGWSGDGGGWRVEGEKQVPVGGDGYLHPETVSDDVGRGFLLKAVRGLGGKGEEVVKDTKKETHTKRTTSSMSPKTGSLGSQKMTMLRRSTRRRTDRMTSKGWSAVCLVASGLRAPGSLCVLRQIFI